MCDDIYTSRELVVVAFVCHAHRPTVCSVVVITLHIAHPDHYVYRRATQATSIYMLRKCTCTPDITGY